MVGTGQIVSDEKILHDTMQHLNHFHSGAGPGAIALVETAGGVSSPTPSNSIQVLSSMCLLAFAHRQSSLASSSASLPDKLLVQYSSCAMKPWSC